jgi:hypothetical protein
MLRITIIGILIFSFVSLACNLGLGNRQPVPPETLDSPQSVDSQDNLHLDFTPSDEQNGLVILILNESEVTDIIAAELHDIDGTSIRDIQVFLREGQVQIFGNVNIQGVRANSRIFLVPQITRQGQIRFVIVSAYYSLFPIPEDMISNLQTGIDDNFSNFLQPLIEDVIIESVSVSEGIMTITGREN